MSEFSVSTFVTTSLDTSQLHTGVPSRSSRLLPVRQITVASSNLKTLSTERSEHLRSQIHCFIATLLVEKL